MTSQSFSPTERGAANGLKMGGFLVAMTAMSFAGEYAPLLGMLSTVMLLVAPYVLYRLLRVDHINASAGETFGQLWLDGVITIACGSLLASAAAFVYMRWIDTEFIARGIDNAAKTFAATGDPAAVQYAQAISSAAENGVNLSPIMMTVSMLWLACTSGLILSLIVAAVARQRPTINITPTAK